MAFVTQQRRTADVTARTYVQLLKINTMNSAACATSLPISPQLAPQHLTQRLRECYKAADILT
jgi:hypothetical protein